MRTLKFAVFFTAIFSSCHAASLIQRDTPSASCTPTLKPSPSPKLHCGKSFTLKRPSLLKVVSLASAADQTSSCYSACSNTKNCVSFGVSSVASECRLYHKSIDKMGYTMKASSLILYNIGCFDCIVPITCTSGIGLTLPTAISPYDFASRTATADQHPNTEYNVTLPFSLFSGTLAQDESTFPLYLTGYIQIEPSQDNYYSYGPFYLVTDSLVIVKGQDHGIFYQVFGEAPNRSALFEWRATNYGHDNVTAHSELYNFYLQVYEANSDAVFAYRELSEPTGGYIFTQDGPNGETDYDTANPQIPIYNGLGLAVTIDGTFAPENVTFCGL